MSETPEDKRPRWQGKELILQGQKFILDINPQGKEGFIIHAIGVRPEKIEHGYCSFRTGIALLESTIIEIDDLRAQLAESEEKREAAEADAGELRRKWRELKNLHEKRNTVNSRNSSPSAFNYDEGAVLEAENAVFYFLEDIEEILSSDHPGADRLKKLEEALEWYANDNNWTSFPNGRNRPPRKPIAFSDNGVKARAALGRE